MCSVSSADTYYSLFSKRDDKADLNCTKPSLRTNGCKLKRYKFHLGVWCPEGHISEGSLNNHLHLSRFSSILAAGQIGGVIQA